MFEDEALKKFEPALEKAAEFLAETLLRMTPVLIRFNDDCDGISSGILIKKAVEEFALQNEIPFPKGFCKNRQCNSAVYDTQDASWDCSERSFPEYGKKPVLVLLDFGGNEESIPGIETASEKFDTLVIDHHVYSEKAKEAANVFLNPLEFGGGSWHTTGLIAYEFAKRLVGEKAMEWEEFAIYSLESDKSIYRKKEDFKQTLVLDYLARQDVSLEKYEKALKEDLNLHYLEAKGKIDSARDTALKKSKAVQVESAKLVIVDFEGTVEKNQFPPKGKILNEVQKHYGGEKEGELVASVSFDSTVSQFRVSKALHKKGFKATKIIEMAKKEFPEINGGGHEQAAAMRFPKEIGRTVFDFTIGICKSEIERVLKEVA